MQLLFLLIFLLFIVLNVVIGLASSRAKKRRASQGGQGMEVSDPERLRSTIGRDERQYRETETLESGGEGPEYFLEPQTAESLVRSMSEAAREQQRVHTEQLARAERESVDRSMMRDEVPDIADERAPLPGGVVEVGKQRSAAAAEAPAEAPTVKDSELSESPVRLTELTEPLNVRTRLDVPGKVSPSEEPKSPAGTEGASRERPAARSGPAWRYVERLPGLKRAVILSEILGRPRSLSEGSHTH